jgi:DnaJ-class molecular chaperone
MDISLKEALLGYEKTFKHMDDHEFTLVNEPGKVTQPFSWNIMKDEGMPIKDSGGDYGELHTKILVNFPTRLSSR